ncbi:hypothetical protein CEXT_697091, partial [Caerostris extrusa]
SPVAPSNILKIHTFLDSVFHTQIGSSDILGLAGGHTLLNTTPVPCVITSTYFVLVRRVQQTPSAQSHLLDYMSLNPYHIAFLIVVIFILWIVLSCKGVSLNARSSLDQEIKYLSPRHLMCK